jgi:predicted permease
VHELRFGWRRAWQQPGWSAVAVASLALGIAACTIVFTLLDRVVWRPLPIREPHRLVQLSSLDRMNRAGYLPLSALDVIDQADLFDGVCAFLTPQSTVEIGGEVRPLAALALSGRCFDVLGVRPAAGRLLGSSDDVRGAPNVAVLSYDMWQRQFSGAPDAIGRTFSIEGEPFTIVGVAERRFMGLQVGFPSLVMVPLRPLAFLPASIRNRPLAANVFARLRPTVSPEATFERLQTIWPDAIGNADAGQANGRPSATELRVQMTSAATGLDSTARTRFRIPLLALMGIAALVLAAASLNVASLHLLRFIERRREYAVRAALGASRWQLIREAAVETVLLLVPAVALSAWIAETGVRVLLDVYTATSRNFGLDSSVDSRVLLFVAAVAGLSWLGFGLGPICFVGSTPPAAVTANGAFGNSTRRGRASRSLVVAQIALTSLLVTCAGWFAGSIGELRAAPRGWTAEHLLVTRLAAIPGGYDDSFQASIYYRRLLEGIAALPGVRSVALTNAAPPIPTAFYREQVAAADRRDRIADATALRVSDEFFAALQLPLITGAGFARSDQPSDSRTAVVSEALARQLFDTTAVLDRLIVVRARGSEQTVRIVGVAADAVIDDPRVSTQPTIYLNYWQQDTAFQQFPALLVRSDARLDDVAAGVRAEIAAGGREYPLGMTPAIDSVEAGLVQERLLSITSSLFAGIGLFLAAVGLFGLVSRTVVSRTKELGIRAAVGATSRDLIRLVIGDTLFCLAAGIAIAIPLVVAAARLLGGLLYGPGAHRIDAIAVALGLVVATAVAAAWLPARRAARIDPLSALRLE